MQFNTARRSNKTYGKGAKSTLVHDLFDYRSNTDESHATASSNASPAPSKVQLHPTARDLAHGLDSHSPEPVPYASKASIRDREVPKKPVSQDVSLYDMPSSDNDISSDASESRASKRRRLVATVRGTQPSIKKDPQLVLKPLNDTASVQRGMDQIQDKRRGARRTAESSRATFAPQKSRGSARVKTLIPHVNSTDLAVAEKPRPVQRIRMNEARPPISHPSDHTELLDLCETDSSEDHPEHSRVRSRMLEITPQRKKLSPATTDSDPSSPSNIGLTGLKLVTAGLSPAALSPEPDSDASTKHKRGRSRLIDRLDAPGTKTNTTPKEQPSTLGAKLTPSGNRISTKSRDKLTQGERRINQSHNAVANTESLSDSQAHKNLAVKPKMTYATQRSYLSDMVSDLDGNDEPLSQKSTEDILLQISASNVPSQLELDDDSDDLAGGGKIKSIHELRQAGANNRFERELDALLDDIDAGKEVSKALRIQALTKLISRLQDASFSRHVSTGGRISRLTTVSTQELDLSTSILLMTVYSVLVGCETIPLGTLRQMFKAAADLAPSMLTDKRSLAKVAKDRKQNLSRALVRDLLEFVDNAGIQEDSCNVPDQFCSDSTALSCLERILRKLVQHGDTSARLSTSVYSTILRSLASQVLDLEHRGDKPSHLSKTSMTLSLLELCSFCIDDADLHIADNEYENLGNSLAEIIQQSSRLSRSLEGNVLRVVVSLSNNRPRMCRLLGSTMISKSAFDIINENFLILARQAESEGALDKQKLDSVVLALGCLLNFAECDESLRARLSRRGPGEENYIAQLVAIFKLQVSKVDEAMTTEQSQVSVAFGYLAMLLCTFSLHPGIKAQVTQLLRNKSFAELCNAAEKFFSHLRTLEHISEDDAAMSTFTARFSAILETVRTL